MINPISFVISVFHCVAIHHSSEDGLIKSKSAEAAEEAVTGTVEPSWNNELTMSQLMRIYDDRRKPDFSGDIQLLHPVDYFKNKGDSCFFLPDLMHCHHKLCHLMEST